MKTLTMTLVALMAATGCANNSPDPDYPEDCLEGPADDMKNVAQVTGQGIEAGVETGVAGIKQAADATGGLVTGGTDRADEKWEEGKVETRKEALEGKEEVKLAQRKRCPER